MAGYKLGQKVLLSNGTVKNIEDVQLGDSIYSFDIPCNNFIYVCYIVFYLYAYVSHLYTYIFRAYC